MYGTGISKIGALLDTAYDLKIVDRAGAWYSYEGEKLGQGRENSKQFLEENQDIRQEIEDKVRQAMTQLGSSSEGEDSYVEDVVDVDDVDTFDLS